MAKLLAWIRGPGRMFASLIALLAIQRVFETYAPVQDLERAGYDALQIARTLFGGLPPQRLVVIDMSALAPENGITPRPALQKMLEALKRAGAKAAAIDVDFSPDDNHEFVDAASDPGFFEYCQGLGIPVFLGVARMAGHDRTAWLGRPQYADLAASIVIPRDAATIPEPGDHGSAAQAERHIPGPYPLYIPRIDAKPSDASRFDDLPSMALKLASVWDPRAELRFREDSLWSWVLDAVGERRLDDDHRVSEFAVDYHFANRFARETVTPQWNSSAVINSIEAERIHDSVVLLGDVSGSSSNDVFDRPDSPRRISGVLVHATAAMSVLHPLRVFKPWMRGLLDAICVAAAMIFLQNRAKRRTRRRPSHSKKRRIVSPERVATFWAVGTITIVVAIAALLGRVLWFDWIPVTLLAGVQALFEKAEGELVEAV